MNDPVESVLKVRREQSLSSRLVSVLTRMIFMTTKNPQPRLQFHFTTILHKKRKTRADSVVGSAPTEFQIGFPGCSFMTTFPNVSFPFFDTTNFGASELIKRTEKLHAVVHSEKRVATSLQRTHEQRAVRVCAGSQIGIESFMNDPWTHLRTSRFRNSA